MKCYNFILAILLFISSFQHFPFIIDFNSHENSVDQLFSSLKSPNFNKWVESRKNQGTDIFIQIEEIFEIETALNFYLILFGIFIQDYQKYRDVQKD